MVKESLHHTEDAVIVDTIENYANFMFVNVEVQISPEHKAFYQEKMLTPSFTLKSAIARSGLNAVEYGSKPWIVGNVIRANIFLYSFIGSYNPRKWQIGDFFHAGLKLGKFYVRDPESGVEKEELLSYLKSGIVRVDKKSRVIDDGLLMVPLDPIIYLPGDNWSKVILQKIINNGIKRLELRDYVTIVDVPSQNGITVPIHDGIIGSTHLDIENDLEVIVEGMDTDAIRHSSAVFGASGNQKTIDGSPYLFYVEVLPNHEQDICVKEVGIRFYHPVFAKDY